VSGRPPIRGAYRPAIARENGATRARRYDGLYSNYKSLVEYLVSLGIGKVWYARFFMNGSTDAVSAKLADH